MKFLSPEVALYLYKSTIHPCRNTVASSGLVPLVATWTVGPSLAASHEPLAHCQNVASLSLFYRYYFGRCSSELPQLVPLLFFEGGLLIILIDCMVFLSIFLDVTRMYISTVSLFTQLGSGILYL